MKVDASKPICGVRPAVLKNLLRNDFFDTPTAMECLDLDEPYVTETLTRLERARWISFAGTHDGVDTWKIESRGMRLTATRLMKRIGAAEGRAILARLIEEVRTVNADESLSRRVRSVLLFGSLITASDEDTIGDIDVVVYSERRAVTDDVLEALEKQEVAALAHSQCCDSVPCSRDPDATLFSKPSAPALVRRLSKSHAAKVRVAVDGERRNAPS